MFTHTHLICASINIDTITNKKDELLCMIHDYAPHIIAVTEIKPKNARYQLQESELNITGYEKFPNLAGNRGVCLYIKESLAPVKHETLSSDTFAECIWCTLKANNNTELLIGCVYRSPNSTGENNTALEKMLKLATRDQKTNVVVLGDFNYPDIDWINESCRCSTNHPASKFLECTRDCFLTQHVLEPTHFRGEQSANTLDLVLSSDENLISDVKVKAPVGKSHHGTIICKVNLHVDVELKLSSAYLYDKGDYHKMTASLEEIDWKTELEDRSLQQSWDYLHKTILEIQDKYIPKRTIKGTGDKRRKPLWMNDRALTKVKKKQAAWKRYLETRDGKSYQEYCRSRNQARKATRIAVREFEKNITKEAKSNPKAFYKYVQSKTKSRTGIGDLVTEDGTTTSDDLGKAEALNAFFASVFTEEDPGPIPDFQPRSVESPLSNIEITPDCVEKKLKQLKACKSAGPDRIHPRVLKELASPLSTPLSILFQRSLECGELPDAWREGTITPIFKKGAKDKPGNYRPVSLTSVVCKVMESIIRDQIIIHMKNNSLLSPHQHGFISGRSCMTQLLEVMEVWTKILDEKGSIDTIFFDFMKAFDSVPHRRLAAKWKAYGITGKVSNWLEAFLSNRRQRVNVNNNHSTWKNVLSGVPQGSVIGPILFVIYINDLPEMVEHTIKLFADDTKLFTKVSTIEDCSGLQQDINKLLDWSSKWLLKFHPAKCKVLRVGTGHPDYQYHMLDDSNQPVTLEEIPHEKDIGVFMDRDLKFRTHIDSTIAKANRLVGMIRRSLSTWTYQHLRTPSR